MIDYIHLSIGRGSSIHAEKRSHGKAWKPAKLTDEEQEEIDACLEDCPWPDDPEKCEKCNGHPELFRRKKAHYSDICYNAGIMWLEYWSNSPKNNHQGKTRQILKMLKGG